MEVEDNRVGRREGEAPEIVIKGSHWGSRNSCKQPGLTEAEQNGRHSGYSGLLPLADPYFNTDLQAHLFEDKHSNSNP